MGFSPCLSERRPSHGLAMGFSPCLSRKRPSWDLACACDCLSLLPVEEKAVSWTWLAFAMAFSPCLSRKRPSHGLCPHLRWPFPSACRGKGRIVDALASLRLPFPSQGEGKGQFQVSSASPQRGLERTPKVARELPSQKTINFDYFRLLKSVDLSRVENTKKWGGSGHEMFMDSACACDDLFPLPVKGKAVLWTWCAFAMAFPPCLSRKRP